MHRLIVTIILAAMAILLPAAGAQAARGMEVAIQDEDVFVDNKTLSPDRGYAALRQLGVKRMRMLVTQAGVENGNGFDFAKYDRAIGQAAANGVRVQLVLVGRYPRPNVPSFARFAGAAAGHFQGRVDRYSIWNEPNFKSWLAPVRRAPALYRKLYIAGYKAVKAADRRAKVLIGETAPYAQGARAMAPVKFIKKVARAGKLKSDGYAHHPYDFDNAPQRSKRGRNDATIGSLSNMTKALDQLARQRKLTGTKALYLTEYGYLATGRRGISEAKRAKYLKKGLSIARKNRRVKQVVQYLLAQPSDGSPFTTGILSTNGAQLPSFGALMRAAR